MQRLQEVFMKADGKERHLCQCDTNDFLFLECVLCTDDIMIFSVCREDVRTVNVIAAGEVTCLVIDRE